MKRRSPSKERPNRREAAAETTRALILATARDLFIARGYPGTTIEAIATEAGVAVQTIYNSVGGKSALLTRVFEDAVVGDRAPRSAPEVMRERVAGVTGAAAMLSVLSDWLVEANTRMAELWRVIDGAAAVDAEVATLARERAHRRLRNYREAATELGRRGGLPAGVDVEDAAAIIWAIGHPTAYRTFVLELGWSTPRYRQWVEAALGAAFDSSPGR